MNNSELPSSTEGYATSKTRIIYTPAIQTILEDPQQHKKIALYVPSPVKTLSPVEGSSLQKPFTPRPAQQRFLEQISEPEVALDLLAMLRAYGNKTRFAPDHRAARGMPLQAKEKKLELRMHRDKLEHKRPSLADRLASKGVKTRLELMYEPSPAARMASKVARFGVYAGIGAATYHEGLAFVSGIKDTIGKLGGETFTALTPNFGLAKMNNLDPFHSFSLGKALDPVFQDYSHRLSEGFAKIASQKDSTFLAGEHFMQGLLAILIAGLIFPPKIFGDIEENGDLFPKGVRCLVTLGALALEVPEGIMYGKNSDVDLDKVTSTDIVDK